MRALEVKGLDTQSSNWQRRSTVAQNLTWLSSLEVVGGGKSIERVVRWLDRSDWGCGESEGRKGKEGSECNHGEMASADILLLGLQIGLGSVCATSIIGYDDIV